MEKVNVIFGDDICDVDIIAIPKDIAQIIDTLAGIFSEWLLKDAPQNDNDYWVEINGKICSNLETKGFVKWLNSYYCNNDNKAYIVEQHTIYCSKYKCIEF